MLGSREFILAVALLCVNAATINITGASVLTYSILSISIVVLNAVCVRHIIREKSIVTKQTVSTLGTAILLLVIFVMLKRDDEAESYLDAIGLTGALMLIVSAFLKR